MNRRPTQKQLFIGFICVDVLLLLAAILLFGYILSHRGNSNTVPEVVAPTSTASVSPSPSPAFTPTPTLAVTPQPLQTASFTAFQFSYDAKQMTVQDRSQEVGGETVAVTGSNDDIPRVDIQVLEPLPGLTQSQFETLARSAVRTYFAAPPEDISLEDSVTGLTEYSAQLVLPETVGSPAMVAHIRLLLGSKYSILAICLLPEDTDVETASAFRDILNSVTST